MKQAKPLAPAVQISQIDGKVTVKWQEKGKRRAFWFVVYAKDANGWSYSILPQTEKSIVLSANRKISTIAIASVDRLGNESKIQLISVK